MIVVMRRGATKKQVDVVLARIAEAGQPVHAFHGEERVVIAVLGADPTLSIDGSRLSLRADLAGLDYRAGE